MAYIIALPKLLLVLYCTSFGASAPAHNSKRVLVGWMISVDFGGISVDFVGSYAGRLQCS
jgi:hypothetical protein